MHSALLASYRDTEIAAVKHLADWAVRKGMSVSWTGICFTAKLEDHNFELRVVIRPAREADGLFVTVYQPTGRKILDGQDYMFMHDEAAGIVNLEALIGELL